LEAILLYDQDSATGAMVGHLCIPCKKNAQNVFVFVAQGFDLKGIFSSCILKNKKTLNPE
jgi:hypothetical protein